jgi:uncharacterized RDD family membrane protein YckC
MSKPNRHEILCPNCGYYFLGDPITCTVCGRVLPRAETKTAQNLPAGFWLRAGAFALDACVVFIAISIIQWPLTRLHDHAGRELHHLIGQVNLFLFWFFPGIYFTLLESGTWQATVGKKLVGIRVANGEGNRITFFAATLRYFSKALSLVSLIGFLLAGITRQKRALHDLLANTFVII